MPTAVPPTTTAATVGGQALQMTAQAVSAVFDSGDAQQVASLLNQGRLRMAQLQIEAANETNADARDTAQAQIAALQAITQQAAEKLAAQPTSLLPATSTKKREWVYLLLGLLVAGGGVVLAQSKPKKGKK